MSLRERMDFWAEAQHYDHQPTDEEALRQFLYVAIGAFVAEHPQELVEWLTDDQNDGDEVPRLNGWVDEYAERPLSESSGWSRHPKSETGRELGSETP